MSICKGCGAHLQSDHPELPGYTPKAGSAYCQRCFRLIHYDDLMFSMAEGIDSDVVLEGIEKRQGLIVWVVDLFDFEAGMIPGMNRKLPGRDILLVCTKRDLLPDTLSNTHLSQFIFRRLNDLNTQVKGVFVTSRDDEEGILELKQVIRKMAKDQPVIFMGKANSGKSTLINRIIGQEILTSSRYPGTTLDFNEIQTEDQLYIDTPGIEIRQSMLKVVKEDQLSEILPVHAVKPRVYQLHEDQCYTIGGMAQIILRKVRKATAVFYLADQVAIHRAKAENADKLWQAHYGELFVPVPQEDRFTTSKVKKTEEKTDIVIDGLGWICVSGNVQVLEVKAPVNVNVTYRKAMI
ncbi:MAG: ribosome biogenesis GTPase YqeH [Solobacterium sp.]|nr:ribosome biogenesis GTPase YqeH [Solobacterium sp.]